jgi:hypothetical protein
MTHRFRVPPLFENILKILGYLRARDAATGYRVKDLFQDAKRGTANRSNCGCSGNLPVTRLSRLQISKTGHDQSEENSFVECQHFRVALFPHVTGFSGL